MPQSSCYRKTMPQHMTAALEKQTKGMHEGCVKMGETRESEK